MHKKSLIFLLLSLALTILGLSLAITLSPTNRIAYSTKVQIWDWRTQGIDRYGKVDNDKVDNDYSFEDPRILPQSANITVDKYQSDDNSTFINYIEVTPRLWLLLPSFDYAWLPVFLILIISLLLTLVTSTPYLWFLPPISANLLWFCSPIDHWERANYLFGFIALLLAGFYGAQKFSSNTSFLTIKKPWLIVITITIFGFWLRASVISFGLPDLYHPDESRKGKIAARMVETADPNPRYFRHPSFLLYSSAGITYLKSTFTQKKSIPQDAIHSGRLTSSILGAGSILLIFLIASFLYGNLVGVTAAALFTVAPLHVTCSRYLKEDAAMLFFVLLASYFSIKAIFAGKAKTFLPLTGIAAGFAVSVKYSGLLSLFIVLAPLVIALSNKIVSKTSPSLIKDSKLASHSIQELIVSTTIGLLFIPLIFILVTPYSVLDYPTFIKDFSAEGNHMRTGHAGAISSWAYYWCFHLSESILPALTTPISLLSLVALGLLLFLRTWREVIIIGGLFLFYLPAEYVNAKPFPQPERYILPCIAFLCISLAVFLVWISSEVSNKQFRMAKYFPFLIILACLSLPTYFVLKHRSVIMNDTRLEAKHWIAANIPSNANVVTDWSFYSPTPNPPIKTIQLKSKEGAKLLGSISIKSLQQSNIDYLIVSSFFYDRYIRQVKRGGAISLGFSRIFSNLEPIAIFENSDMKYGFHNPTIKIFKIPKINQ
jgi:Dolichyl-phosphate-mannose-protein mannosyltransferase